MTLIELSDNDDAGPAPKRQKTLGMEYADGFITVEVGQGDIQIFRVHRSILCQSPVFSAMIASQFKEGLTKIVQLPENDHEDFGLVLRFLYKGDSGFYPIGEPGPALFEKLADLYIVAEKYDIRSLKECVIRGLGTISKEPMEYKTFFKITDKITHNTPETDTLFWDFFHDRARSVLGNGSTITEASSLMYAVVAEGGKFGEELWTVMNEVWLQKIGNLTTEKDAIKKKYESFRSRLLGRR